MNYNEWLLEDRLHVIDDIIIKPQHNFKIQITGNAYRDIVLVDLFKTLAQKYDSKIHMLHLDEPEIIITSIGSPDNEEINCAEYDENHRLVRYNPLAPCGDDWIAWYISKHIERF